MKIFKFLILVLVVTIVNSCGFFFPKREKQVFKPELVETGFVLEKKIIKYEEGYNKGQIQWYNVVVLDSCKNRTTYHTIEDCYNSLNSDDAVHVYTIEKLTKKYEVYSIKKFIKEYE